jgi:hypothetical protein
MIVHYTINFVHYKVCRDLISQAAALVDKQAIPTNIVLLDHLRQLRSFCLVVDMRRANNLVSDPATSR